MHAIRIRLLPGAIALALALAALPFSQAAPVAATTSGLYQANCSANLRTRPSTGATLKARIPANTVVRVSGIVSGSSYATTCRTGVSGSSWFVVTAIGGRSTSYLYGVAKLYIASKLVRSSWSSYLEGIDVSSWQSRIDFGRVRASGRSFVMAKASEGRYSSDSMYASHRSGAAAAGLAFAAYHFARPDATPNDAILEADNFIDSARLKHGDLLPVLDIERSGGLGTAALQKWISAWLARVKARLGVKAIIYTNRTFWRTHVGDSTAYAAAGYRLWVAHWDATAPGLPAAGWDGTGWRAWQYDSCGSVPGVSGCADLDRIRDPDLTAITY